MMIELPTAEIEGETWILLKHIDKTWIFRADGIDKRKKRRQERDGHHYDEAHAEGSVKCKPRSWEFSRFNL